MCPGSHKLGDAYATALGEVTNQAKIEEALGFASGAEVPAVAMETTELAGDVVVFNHNCKHSAWGG